MSSLAGNLSVDNHSLLWHDSSVNATSAVLECEKQTQNEFLAQAICLIFILIATFLGNALVIATVCLDFELRAHTTGCFIASLAVSDLLVALLSLPLRIDQTLHNFKWCLGEDLCAFWIWSDMVCSCASVCNLAAISIDRLIYITEPLTYQYRMSNKIGYRMIAFVWGYSVLFASMSYVNWTYPGLRSIETINECARRDPIYYTVVTSGGFFLPLIISIVCYTTVFHIAITQANKFREKPQALSPKTTRTGSILARSPMIVRKLVSNSSAMRHYKATKTLAIVLGVFIISWCPFFILLLVSLWCDACNRMLDSHPGLSRFVKIVFVYTLPAVNSTLNPIIYAVHNSQFRVAFRRQLRKILIRRQVKRPNNSTPHQLKELNGHKDS